MHHTVGNIDYLPILPSDHWFNNHMALKQTSLRNSSFVFGQRIHVQESFRIGHLVLDPNFRQLHVVREGVNRWLRQFFGI